MKCVMRTGERELECGCSDISTGLAHTQRDPGHPVLLLKKRDDPWYEVSPVVILPLHTLVLSSVKRTLHVTGRRRYWPAFSRLLQTGPNAFPDPGQ